MKGRWLSSDEGEDYVEEQEPQSWRNIAEMELDLLRENPKPRKPVPAWQDDTDEVNVQYTFNLLLRNANFLAVLSPTHIHTGQM